MCGKLFPFWGSHNTAPRNIKEVQKFLGLTNYYRRFIKDFARIAAPLHVLVRKEQKWK